MWFTWAMLMILYLGTVGKASHQQEAQREGPSFLFASQTLTRSIDAISEFLVIATTARTIFSERGKADGQRWIRRETW
jgi:hypothetical protein